MNTARKSNKDAHRLLEKLRKRKNGALRSVPKKFGYSMVYNVMDREPQTAFETFAEIAEGLKDLAELDAKDGPAFIGATFDGNGREDSNVEEVTWLTLDLDDAEGTIDGIQGPLTEYRRIVYTTRSHGVRFDDAGKAKWEPGRPRFRVLVPYARPINDKEHRAIWSHVFDLLDGAPDKATKNPARLQYCPRAKHPRAECDPIFERHDSGPLLNPDSLPDGKGGKVSVAELLERQASPTRPEPSSTSSRAPEQQDNGEWINPKNPNDWRDLLFAIPADVHEDDWKAVIWAFTNSYGDNADAKALLQDWSKTSTAHDWNEAADAFEDRWSRGLAGDCDRPVTMGTVVKLARKHGYKGQSPARRRNEGPTFPRKDEWLIAEHVAKHKLGRVVYDEGGAHVYDPEIGTFEPRDDRTIKKAIGTELRNAKIDQGDDKPKKPIRLSAGFIRGVAEMLETQTAEPGFFAGEKPGVAFRNGFLALDGNKVVLQDKSPENRCRFALEMDYDAQADCPRWLASLRRAHGHREDCEAIIKVLQEFAGALLFGLAPEYQHALILAGDPKTGKSTFCDVLKGMLPPSSLSAISPQMMGNRFGLADLPGKRANIVNETPVGRVLNGEVFKAVVTGDAITVEQKGKDQFSHEPRAGHLFAANDLPEVPGADPAFWRRWLVVPHDRVIPDSEIVRGFAEQVAKDEGPGIVRWAAEGVERLVKQCDYTEATTCQKALEEWKGDADSVARFAKEMLWSVENKGDGSKITDLHGEYREWHKRQGGQYSVGRKEFKTRLKHLGFFPFDSLHNGYKMWNAEILAPAEKSKRENKQSLRVIEGGGA